MNCSHLKLLFTRSMVTETKQVTNTDVQSQLSTGTNVALHEDHMSDFAGEHETVGHIVCGMRNRKERNTSAWQSFYILFSLGTLLS